MKNLKSLSFSKELIKWFDKYGRKDLPWQGENSYYVWISEIMLQQTQVSKVLDYFSRFILTFPTLDELAQADESQVLQLWSGLGYYNRAKNLHKTALLCQQKYNGSLPKDINLLIQLPGIGQTTAAAILSLASNLPYPILDGNVKRVVSRVFAIQADKYSQLNRLLWNKVSELMEQQRARDYNQALMDLGAMICRSNNPKCQDCPLKDRCKARLLQQIDRYPQKQNPARKIHKSYYLLMVVQQNKVFLQQRAATGIWPSLWFLPCYDNNQDLLKDQNDKRANFTAIDSFSVQHILSHRVMTLEVSCVISPVDKRPFENGRWIGLEKISQYPHPKSLFKIIKAFQGERKHATA